MNKINSVEMNAALIPPPKMRYQAMGPAGLNDLVVDLRQCGHVRLEADFFSADFKEVNECNVVFSGTCKLDWKGKRHDLKAGHLYLFPGFQRRKTYACDRLEKLFFHFRLLYRGIDLFRDAEPLALPFPKGFETITSRSREAMERGDLFASKAALLESLAPFQTAIGKILSKKTPAYQKHESFFQLVETRIRSELEIGEAAQLAGRTEKAFAADFKKSFGLSPKQFFLREKTRRIQEVLTHTDLPAGKIAEDFGFTDAFYFSRFFKKMSGLTPMDYRRQSR
ncbi:MAG: helix-turn-helix transcriptional regulator [Spirochaetia bacterium]|nr:helix-turn-helix transcriptional regulator [Spirochaetia bacterium]